VIRIGVLDDWSGVAPGMAPWENLDAEVVFFRDTVADEDTLRDRLEPFDVICLMRERTPMPGSLIRRLPRLRLLVTTGPRNLSIDMDAARAAGVTVCGTESRKTTTSEFAITLLLMLARGVGPEAASMRNGGWQVGLGRDVHGMVLGLVGLGTIGAQVAERARVFGMDVIAWSQNLTEERCGQVGVGYRRSLAALLTDADAVSIHLVLSERTSGLFDTAAFTSMKPDGMLINTSRGPIIRNDSLLTALRSEPRRRAALDVFDEEPLPPTHPLRDRELIDAGRLLLTPHLGYATEATWRLFYGQTVKAIEAWMAGTPIRSLTG